MPFDHDHLSTMHIAVGPGPRRGRTGSSTVRLLVLLALLLGVGVFGFIRRPDLVRQHLKIDAPAWDSRQALTFANEDLFKVASALAVVEVAVLDTNEDTLVAMGESGGFVEGLTQQELLEDPTKAAEYLGRQIDRIAKDARRAADKLSPSKFNSAEEQGLVWKTLSLAQQVQDALKTIASTPLGQALEKQNAIKNAAATVATLEAIQKATAPARKKSPTGGVNPDAMRWNDDDSDS